MPRLFDALDSLELRPPPPGATVNWGGVHAKPTPCGWCLAPGVGLGHLVPATGTYTCALVAAGFATEDT